MILPHQVPIPTASQAMAGYLESGVEIIQLMPALCVLRQEKRVLTNEEGQGHDAPWPLNLHPSMRFFARES
jgi:hypothetical protein